MDISTAKQVITEAMNIAVLKGCFNLVEVTNIVKAIEVVNDQPEFGELEQ
jgi:hypothetical protein